MTDSTASRATRRLALSLTLGPRASGSTEVAGRPVL